MKYSSVGRSSIFLGAIGGMHETQVIFGWDPLWVAVTLFVLTYLVIITEWVNRAIVALLGAALFCFGAAAAAAAAPRC